MILDLLGNEFVVEQVLVSQYRLMIDILDDLFYAADLLKDIEY